MHDAGVCEAVHHAPQDGVLNRKGVAAGNLIEGVEGMVRPQVDYVDMNAVAKFAFKSGSQGVSACFVPATSLRVKYEHSLGVSLPAWFAT